MNPLRYSRKRKSRIAIIGLDGMPYRLIRHLSEHGTMPHTRALIEEGTFRQMESSIPEISSVAWSSIITGKNPAEHGIFGFTDLAPGTYRMIFPNFNSLKAPAFWEREGSGRSVIINVPSTYPARELNGVLIAGFVALDLEKATYPPSLVPKLNSMDYRIDVDYQRAGESISYFLTDLDRTLRARIATYRYLWDAEDWDIFMLVFTGVDRLAHFLWHAYENPAHEYHAAFLDHLHHIDQVIGEIAEKMEDGVLIMLSDHGFEQLDKEVYVNFLLQREGFLRFESGLPSNFKYIGEGTKAFALDPGRIYVHLKGKYPRGCVDSADREMVIRDLESLLASLEINGRRVMRRVYRKEEIYEGPLFDQAPDLIPVASTGFNLRPSLNTGRLWGKDQRTGKHSQHDAFLLVRGEGAEGIVPEKPKVTDVVSILDEFLNRMQMHADQRR
jgi:predicted AlkP superfamily phosphohydrolase/phosphomutase